MGKYFAKVVAATALFGLVHSALASRAAKRTAAALSGERNRNGLYRLFYIGQSLVTFAALAVYVRGQPGRELYQIRGTLGWLLRAGQVAAIIHATAAARQIGLRRIVGLESFEAWRRTGDVPPEPEAQGPALNDEGVLHVAGPFTWSRHPLNFSPIAVFWLNPRMTTNLLAFNLAATAYLVVGSIHEEARLLDAYGDAYRHYQKSGVPFYVPRPALFDPPNSLAAAQQGGIADRSAILVPERKPVS